MFMGQGPEKIRIVVEVLFDFAGEIVMVSRYKINRVLYLIKHAPDFRNKILIRHFIVNYIPGVDYEFNREGQAVDCLDDLVYPVIACRVSEMGIGDLDEEERAFICRTLGMHRSEA